MNSKWHLYLSLIKSVVRTIGCMSALILGDWKLVAVGMGMAEVCGFLEEFGDKR